MFFYFPVIYNFKNQNIGNNNNVVWNIGDDYLFLKKSNKTVITLLLTFLIIPINTLAYSDRIIAGGENIGITLNSKGVLIVGTYTIDGENLASKAGLKTGDLIQSINGQKINNIDEMASAINSSNNDEITISYQRNKNLKTTKVKISKDENGVYKTGLYVKDSVTGIGTLTYIDPDSKHFGALGHEIEEQTTGKLLEIKDGKIYDSKVTGITPSNDGSPGEKKAEYDSSKSQGSVKENTTQGIFGTYEDKLPNKKTYKVASKNDIKTGSAKILTVLNGTEIKEYDINITQITNKNAKNKNFIFEITDKTLKEKTGGIIQGMSGSPIIQGDYIVGAVTHVVVNNPYKGYGIFITNMLEEGEN